MSRLRSRFHAFYRCAAFLALLAMFVPVVTGLVHHPVAMPVAAQTMMPSMMMPGQPCPMEQGKNNDDGKNHKAPVCPICQSLHILAGGYIPPAPVALVDNALPAAAPVFTLPNLPVAFAVMPQARPRAPPIFA